MRREAAILGTFLLVYTAAAHAEIPPPIKLGWEGFTANGGFLPKKLPRREFAPAELALEAEVLGAPGSPTPALKELDFEVDRNVSADPEGLPTCPGPVQSYPAPECGPALIGRGEMEVEIDFPESEPREVSAKLLAYNGRAKEGKRSIWVHAFFTSPVNGELMMKGSISKERIGRYGTKLSLKIPKIAGGYGSVENFTLTMHRRFAYKGRRHSYLLARCPGGRLGTRATGVFTDGSSATDSFVRACTPKG